MKTCYFTFGQEHIHDIGGIVFDKDTVVRIKADDPREKVFTLFGRKWSMQYDYIPDMSYFPGGIIDASNL
jgi:hypothetical protein